MKPEPHPFLPAVQTWMAGFFIAVFTLILPCVAVVGFGGKTELHTNHPYTTHGVHSYAQP